MKKVLLSVIALVSMNGAVGQETQVDQTSSSLYKQLKAMPASMASAAKKILELRKAAAYFKEAGTRNCLSGINCSKRQAYIANFLLGASYGFVQGFSTAALMADPLNPQEEVLAAVELVSTLVADLGYRSLVKNKVNLFRCITFRGCDEQTKRYAFFTLGRYSGQIGAFSSIALHHELKERSERYEARKFQKQAQAARQESRKKSKQQAESSQQRSGRQHSQSRPHVATCEGKFIKIEDDNVKKELGLEGGKSSFQWYKILGFQDCPNTNDAKRSYRQKVLKYHPDKAPEAQKPLFGEVMKALSNAKDEGGF